MGQQQERITDGGAGAKRKNAMGDGSPSGLGGSGGAKNSMGKGASVEKKVGANGGKNNMRSGK